MESVAADNATASSAPRPAPGPIKQTTTPTLYHFTSSQSSRIVWALEELSLARGLNYHLKTFRRKWRTIPKEFMDVAKPGKSPILTVSARGSEDTETPSTTETYQQQPGVLVESQLIMRFLSDEYGGGLWEPETEEDRRRDAFWNVFGYNSLASDVLTLVPIAFMASLYPPPISWLVRLLMMPITHFFHSGISVKLQMAEDVLSDEKPYFSGSKLGLADITMTWPLDTLAHWGWLDAAKFSKLDGWRARIQSREAHTRAIEKGGPYDLYRYL